MLHVRRCGRGRNVVASVTPKVFLHVDRKHEATFTASHPTRLPLFSLSDVEPCPAPTENAQLNHYLSEN